MAQGRADKRFLATSAKTASTGVLLVLAVAAILLTGCGGESSDTSGEGSSEASSTATAPSGGAGEAAAGEAGAASGTGATAGAPTASDVAEAIRSAGQGGQSSSGGKKGPPVPIPTGPQEPKITPEQRREATVANMVLQSSSSLPSPSGPDALPAEHTCDGKNVSPALRWQGMPEGTAELVLFAMNIAPVNGALFFDWAVAGLSPELEEIKAGELPKGAVVGRNSFGKAGYGICPEGAAETYMFTLFAVPKKLSPAKGFDPLALRKAVTDVSGDVGILALSYTRG
jgi:phosphatidylethanolamine-binding protein (PEBP) family uncharacterized protein